MAKKITTTLSEVAESHFHELSYSLDLPHKKTTQADIINHCMEECKAFEDITGDQITNYLLTNFPDQYKEWLAKYHIIQY
jgi:hypothetical protein